MREASLGLQTGSAWFFVTVADAGMVATLGSQSEASSRSSSLSIRRPRPHQWQEEVVCTML